MVAIACGWLVQPFNTNEGPELWTNATWQDFALKFPVAGDSLIEPGRGRFSCRRSIELRMVSRFL